jgi:peptidoglycan/xylan/chitin deacetylase (PgdA/CDA1 family)
MQRLIKSAFLLVLVLLTGGPPAWAANGEVLDFSRIVRSGGLSRDCALTFDDGPGEHTGLLLDALKQKRVKATFFVLGKHVRRFPDLIQRMLNEGQEVENHSYDHPDMRKLGEDERRKEIEETTALLKALGATPHYFRPPYGAYDQKLIDMARKDGLEIVLWSHDSEDWRYHSLPLIEANALAKPDAGAHGIFLFHDIQDSTIALMPSIIDFLSAKGCRFLTMDQWMKDNPQPIPPKPEEPPFDKSRIQWF